MAIVFPVNPVTGQQFTYGGVTYNYTAQGVWLAQAAGLATANQAEAVAGTNNSVLMTPLRTAQYVTPIVQQSLSLSTATQNNLVNGKLVESHAGNSVTFAIKTLAGNDPSPSDVVYCIFPDASTLAITTALSLTTPASTYQAGVVSVANKPFRIWFVLINDAGTARIGMFVSVKSDFSTILGFDPRGITNVINTASASVGQVASTVASSNKPYRVIAFADYESGLATASTWAVSPTRIIMVGSNTPMPGTVIQTINFFTSTITNCNSGAWVATALTAVITPFSSINGVLVGCYADHHFNAAATSDTLYAQLFRNDSTASNCGPPQLDWTWSYTTIWGGVMYSQKILDFVFTTAATRYRLYGHLVTSSGNYFYLPYGGGTITLQEIMA